MIDSTLYLVGKEVGTGAYILFFYKSKELCVGRST